MRHDSFQIFLLIHGVQYTLKFQINIPEDIGLPWKIRLGIGKQGKKTNPTSPLPLSYFKMQNTTTLAAFIYSIQESLPVSSNGDNWIEFPVEWPQRSALSGEYKILI